MTASYRGASRTQRRGETQVRPLQWPDLRESVKHPEVNYQLTSKTSTQNLKLVSSHSPEQARLIHS